MAWGWAAPLYWVAYGGMGLFSLIFTGMVAMELSVLGVRLAERGRKQSACRRIRNAADFSIKPPTLVSWADCRGWSVWRMVRTPASFSGGRGGAH